MPQDGHYPKQYCVLSRQTLEALDTTIRGMIDMTGRLVGVVSRLKEELPPENVKEHAGERGR